MGGFGNDGELPGTRNPQSGGQVRHRRITLSGPVVEVDGRASVTSDPSALNPIVDARDVPNPDKLTEPEREDIYRRLMAQEERFWALEKRVDVLEKSRSIPVTLNGPRGYSITGSWRFMLLLTLIVAVVTLAYFSMQYTLKRERKMSCNSISPQSSELTLPISQSRISS